MTLPHEVYTPPGQAPRERSSMSMRRIRTLPYTEGFKPLSGGQGGNHHKTEFELEKLAETKGINGVYNAMRRGGRNAVPPIQVDTVAGIADTFRDWPGDYGDARYAIGNGGHRVAAANALGLKRINIASDIQKTGADWGNSANYTDNGAPHPALSAAQFGDNS